MYDPHIIDELIETYKTEKDLNVLAQRFGMSKESIRYQLREAKVWEPGAYSIKGSKEKNLGNIAVRFGQNLQYGRNFMKLMPAQMAAFLNCSVQKYNQMETGKAEPSIEQFTILSNLFQTHSLKLLDDMMLREASQLMEERDVVKEPTS